MLLLIYFCMIKVSDIDNHVFLLVYFAQYFIFGLLECDVLIFHIDALFVFDLDYLLSVETPITEPAQLLCINPVLIICCTSCFLLSGTRRDALSIPRRS